MTNFGKDINIVLFSKANNLLEVLFINWLDVYRQKKQTKNAEKRKQIYQISTSVERWSLSVLYLLTSYSGISYVP